MNVYRTRRRRRTYQPYVTPTTVRRRGRPRSGSYSSVASSLLSALSSAASYAPGVWRASRNYRSIKPGKVRTLGIGDKAKFRKRKAKGISNNLTGVNRKFAKKVQKVIDHRDAWGEYVRVGGKQLRQTNIDEWKREDTDEYGTPLIIGSPLQLRDAASVLFNSKGMISDWTNGTGNFDKEVPIYVKHQYMTLFFKSTSSHVVNIEVYECTCKDSTEFSPLSLAESSFDDYIALTQQNTGAAGVPSLGTLGVSSRHMSTLNKYYNVKVHKVKLNPGAFSQMVIKGRSNYTMDGSQNIEEAGVTLNYTKGTKSVFFRIINDVTVSGTLGDRIHAWNSNSIGGVAMRYEIVNRMQPPNGVVGKNTLKIFRDIHNVSTETDQQVTLENPAGKAATD